MTLKVNKDNEEDRCQLNWLLIRSGKKVGIDVKWKVITVKKERR